MKTDITLVLYGYDSEDFNSTLDTIIASRESVGRLRVLLSGNLTAKLSLLADLESRNTYDLVELHHRYDNLGFAAGHNFLLGKAFSAGASYALVLNPDVTFTPSALKYLLLVAREQPEALVGPSLAQSNPDREDDDVQRIDSLGIHWTSAGRHFDFRQGEPWEQSGHERLTAVPGVTGACLLVSAQAHRRVVDATDHFFDDLFIAYREDAELGIRAARIGVVSYIVAVDGFRHVRTTRGFQRTNAFINMLGVRNRFLMLLTLGSHRPGSLVQKTLRDALVIIGALTVERSSRVGLTDAWAVRRYARSVRDCL